MPCVDRLLAESNAVSSPQRSRMGWLRRLLGAAALLAFSAPALVTAPLAVVAAPATLCGGLVQAPRLLKEGFRWSEGPVWIPAQQRWVFSDVMADRQFSITPSGELSVFRAPSGYANGNNLSPEGFIVSAQHDRLLTAVSLDGSRVRVLASSYEGHKLNSPNGVAIAPDGSIWFTDPPMGITGYGPVKAEQELAYRGIFRLKGDKLSVMDTSLSLPNGIALAPNGRHLYVSDTQDNTISVFRVSSGPVRLSDKQLFARLTPVPGGGKEGVADGLKVDRQGNVWATGPGGISVFSPDGAVRCQIPFPAHVADLAFGGRDGDLVLVASADKLYLIKGSRRF